MIKIKNKQGEVLLEYAGDSLVMFKIKKKKIDWGDVAYLLNKIFVVMFFLVLLPLSCVQMGKDSGDWNKKTRATLKLEQQTKDSVSLAECYKNGVFTDECAEILSKREIYGENYYEHMDAFQKEMDSFRKGTSND